jgi:hypothetical protein
MFLLRYGADLYFLVQKPNKYLGNLKKRYHLYLAAVPNSCLRVNLSVCWKRGKRQDMWTAVTEQLIYVCYNTLRYTVSEFCCPFYKMAYLCLSRV